MQPTKLIYLEDFNLFASDAKVLQVVQENGKEIIILDQTTFYPQGGGQPYDKGSIEGPSGKFLVEEVRFVDGAVKHIGKFESGCFQTDETIKCLVDEARRALHSRIHSAGHVVDMAVTALKLNWIPGKGYHFPEGKPARVVMYGDFGVPCGGTHVGHLGDTRKMTIRKIKAEGENIRVGYDVER